jgi:hypothetical protein
MDGSSGNVLVVTGSVAQSLATSDQPVSYDEIKEEFIARLLVT